LPHSFEEHNRYRRSKIEAAGSAHRNGNAIVDVRAQQTFGQPFGFTTENKKIATPKFYVPVGTPRLCCYEKIAGIARLGRSQFSKGFPRAQIDFVPIIQSSPFQLSIFQRKAKRLDQMQRRLRSQTKTADISRVRRYLRLNQNNVEHKVFDR
jgi:hypothetical protein